MDFMSFYNKILAQNENNKVLIVLMNSFLTKFAFETFKIERNKI